MMVQHRESKIVLMVLAVDRVALEVVQCVVHPAHVPLEGETQSGKLMWPCHQWPGGRFLRNGDHSQLLRVNNVVEMPQEIYGLEVFLATVLVGHPFIVLARIV